MERAVVSIGVSRTGGLPELQAAVESATQFAKWAREHQKVPASRVKLLTDAKGTVSRERIFKTVYKITQLGFIEQLIVYFSGHGVHSGGGEQWLLSGAPEDSGAAVNVNGSEFSARFCGIGHVIFISDACRTAADSIQALHVTGGAIFPNVKPSGQEKPVDQFFATLIGQPAFEVKTVEESTSRYRAAYSTVLLEALHGNVPTLLKAAEGVGYVHLRPLHSHLMTAVPSFFSTLKLAGVSSQSDSRILSADAAWIAAVPLPAATSPGPTPTGPKRARSRRGAEGRTEGRRDLGEARLQSLGVERRGAGAPSLKSEVSRELRAALSTPGSRRRRGLTPPAQARRTREQGEARKRFEALVSNGRTSFGPDHMESACGVKVRGARIAGADACCAAASVGKQKDVVGIELDRARKGANVLVQLEDGSVVIAPAYRDFITALSFDSLGNLEDVWCEPSANTERWREYQRSVGEIRQLRALIAASTSFGVFLLEEEEEGIELFDRLQQAKTVDPALAVYAAHAWSSRRMRSQVVDLQRYLDSDLGVRIFDVAMLAFSFGKKDGPKEMYPCVPMLTRGWALLSSLGITLPGGLGDLRGELRRSLWTHFTSAAADRVQHVFRQGKVD